MLVPLTAVTATLMAGAVGLVNAPFAAILCVTRLKLTRATALLLLPVHDANRLLLQA